MKNHKNPILDDVKRQDHKVIMCEVVNDFDKRKQIIPTFSFVNKVMSLLHNNNVMSKVNMIEGCDVMTRKTNGHDF